MTMSMIFAIEDSLLCCFVILVLLHVCQCVKNYGTFFWKIVFSFPSFGNFSVASFIECCILLLSFRGNTPVVKSCSYFIYCLV